MKSPRSRSNRSSRSIAALRSNRVGRCEVCRRELAARSLTIVHDDLGDHELCAPCEETYSLNAMRYFGKELHAHAIQLSILNFSGGAL